MNFTADELQAAAQHLLEIGVLTKDLLFDDWCTPEGEELTQAEVDARCIAYLTTKQPKKKHAGGRPKKQPTEKLKCVSAMISPTSYAEFYDKAKEFGMSVSMLLRYMLEPKAVEVKARIARRLPGLLTIEEGQVRRNLAGATGSLYQLAQQARAEGLLELEQELLATCQLIRAAITN